MMIFGFGGWKPPVMVAQSPLLSTANCKQSSSIIKMQHDFVITTHNLNHRPNNVCFAYEKISGPISMAIKMMTPPLIGAHRAIERERDKT